MRTLSDQEINIIEKQLTDLCNVAPKKLENENGDLSNEILKKFKSLNTSLHSSNIENERLIAENKTLKFDNDATKKQIELYQSAKEYSQSRLENATDVLMSLASLNLDRQALISENEDEYDGLSVGLNMLAQELKASTVSINYLDDIFQSMTEVLAVIDKNGVIESINRAGETVFGDKITGSRIESIIYTEKASNTSLFTKNGIKSAIDKNSSIKTEIKVKDKNENPIPMEVLLSAMKSREGIVLIGRDINERKEAERSKNSLLVDLEKSNKELRQFAYITSHDLKAPLRGISTLAQMIQEDCTDILPSPSKAHIELLINRTKRMHSFLEGVLAYSKIGMNKEAYDDIDLNLIVNETLDYIEIPETIKISIKNTLPTINAAKTHMIQLYLNLISNAINYMDKKSGKVEIGIKKYNNKDRLYVKDNGMGIEKSHYNKIFIIFQTIVPRDTVESTGIGLTIVKKIIEQYKGEITLESKIGQGTCFYFTLN